MNNILKYYESFGALRLSFGESLKGIPLTPRMPDENKSSSSIKKFDSVWFNMPRGKAIFKSFDSAYNRDLKDLRIINELLCMELLSQLQIPHAVYKEAHLDEEYGLISYNVLEGEQKLVSLAEFLAFDKENLSNNMVDIREALNYYQKLGYEVNIQEIMLGLFKLMVFDILTLQSDRNNFNINFIFDRDKIKLAPIFDNEYAYAMELAKFIYENEEDEDITSFIKSFSLNAKMLNVDHENLLSPDAIHHNIENLANLAKSNSRMNEFLTMALEIFSPQKAFETLEKNGHMISEEYKSYVIGTSEKIKQLFLNELQKPCDENTSYIYNSFID